MPDWWRANLKYNLCMIQRWTLLLTPWTVIGVGWREGKEGRHEKKWRIFAPSKRRRGGCRKLNWILQQWKLCTVSMTDCMSEVNFSAKLGLHKSFVYLFRSEVELQSTTKSLITRALWSAACCLVCFIHFSIS